MKYCICIALILSLYNAGYAQRRHSVAIGLDLVESSKPKPWRNNDQLKPSEYNSVREYLGENTAIWLSYYYKNRVSLRFYHYNLFQEKHYKNIRQTPDNFLWQREATFYDFTLGYNFAPWLHQKFPSGLWNKTGIWLYGGASLLGEWSSKNYHSYTPIGGWTNEGEYYWTDGARYPWQVKPVAQLMVKYNPVRFVFLGIGGTYRYIDRDFAPVSLNVSVGLQL